MWNNENCRCCMLVVHNVDPTRTTGHKIKLSKLWLLLQEASSFHSLWKGASDARPTKPLQHLDIFCTP